MSTEFIIPMKKAPLTDTYTDCSDEVQDATKSGYPCGIEKEDFTEGVNTTETIDYIPVDPDVKYGPNPSDGRIHELLAGSYDGHIIPMQTTAFGMDLKFTIGMSLLPYVPILTECVFGLVARRYIMGVKSDGSIELNRVDYCNELGVNEDECDVDEWVLDTDDNILHTKLATSGSVTIGVASDGTAYVTGDDHIGRIDFAYIRTWTDLVSVHVGDFFIVGLKSDGTLVYTGDDEEDYSNLDTWANIIQIAIFQNDLVSGLQSDGTILVEDGSQYIGSDNQKIIDEIETWIDITYINWGPYGYLAIDSNKDVVYVFHDDFEDPLQPRWYLSVNGWDDLIQVYFGDNFVIGLKSNGTWLVDTNEYADENYDIKETQGWRNISRILPGDYYRDVIGALTNDNGIIGKGPFSWE